MPKLHGSFEDLHGRQLNMVCVCGAKLPVDSRYSICSSCMNRPDPDDPFEDDDLGRLDADQYEEADDYYGECDE